MPLETERRPVGARETLQAAVEQRHVRRFQIRRKRVRIDGEAVFWLVMTTVPLAKSFTGWLAP